MSQKRSIFEEVGDAPAKDQPKAAVGVIDKGAKGGRRGIRAWLMVLFAMVVVMIAVGGLTRLTDSGLSITEWRPVTGALPPMSEVEWQAEFDKYKQIDQWQIENQWMNLEDFKQIYWWEWGHRQIGRVIGLVWALGFAGFAVARKIPTGWTGRLVLIGALGGLQGAVGWWMVASGVTSGEGVTTVASYRLAVHLGLAFVILGFIAWYVFLLGREERDLMQARRSKEDKLFSLSTGLLHATFVQILLGALVAGIDAGRSYTDWPLMGGQVFPPEAFMIEPLWKNFFENPGLVQFIHRMWGYLLVIFAVVVWTRGRKSANGATRFAFNAVMAAFGVQLLMGIGTVLYAAQVHIAITHQIIAIVVWVLILRARFLSNYPQVQSIRKG
ncbi:COX15/CtaA family protein [Shimia thalassica]|uniref:heme A synthase n=1 Tax=Shimia thalassica TaxID=1715693 RepID=UPI0026E21454|nr:heme A synthase [Shimia thalassica]MDO6522318.1 COX15/CtaA family protein [Shimia thalassica]MDP2493972.1 COX15/CtaA family protein [Shimia thalassica]MDP2520228.1 COX15/CtaA family protein [Shimia thalassica]MDP2579625.1 COX15/CtaA family protein [Shimia thalassica]